jgi:hypothetical protein
MNVIVSWPQMRLWIWACLSPAFFEVACAAKGLPADSSIALYQTVEDVGM